MEKIVIGKYVKTHGIKGEIKLKSNFKYKDKIFQKGKKIIIANQEFIIESYRVHQDYDMLTLKGITNINEILPLKGNLVYAYKEDLKLTAKEYLDTDLLGLNLYMGNSLIGKISDITYITKTKKLLVVNGHYIPFELIKKIDFSNQKVVIEEVQGLI